MEDKEILGYAIPKKSMKDSIIGMNLDPDKRYEIYNKIKYEDSSIVLELKTESGKVLPYCASFFDVEPVDLLNF